MTTNDSFQPLNIVFTCLEFGTLTGVPMYVYELAKELVRQEHNVTVISDTKRPLSKMGEEAGINVCDWKDEEKLYELFNSGVDIYSTNFLATFGKILLQAVGTRTPIVYTVHSEQDIEEPPHEANTMHSNFVQTYITIRPSITDHIIKEYKIDPKKIELVYNGIDLDRFSPKPSLKEQGKNKKYRIIAPCGIGSLRRPFLEQLASRANDDTEIIVYGTWDKERDPWFGKLNVTLEPPRFDIEKAIQDADEVAGILYGRVTLEGWACGKKCTIYDLDGNYEFVEKPKDFEEKHGLPSVARQIVEVYRKAIILGNSYYEVLETIEGDAN